MSLAYLGRNNNQTPGPAELDWMGGGGEARSPCPIFTNTGNKIEEAQIIRIPKFVSM